MKKLLVSLLMGTMLTGCTGVKEGFEKGFNSTYKSGYLNINVDMEDYSEQFYEGVKIRGKGVIESKDNIGIGIIYTTYMHKENPWEHYIELDSEEADKIYKDYNLHMGDYVYFEGMLNEEKEIKIEYLKVIDSPTEELK